MNSLTRREAYNYCLDMLSKADIAEAESDARLLMEYIADTRRERLIIDGNDLLDEAVVSKLKEAVEKRTKHIPLQYITGMQNFMGLEFEVDENVLIPRMDTEILVEEVLRLGYSGINVLDMCTGSGCILLSILKYTHDSHGVGVDISEGALNVARKNSERLGIPARFVHSDLFDELADDERYDIIVSNPPYIRSDVIPTLMEEVKDHEPMLALDGSADGLEFYRKITDASRLFLARGGMLFFEIGYDQGEEVSQIMSDAGFKDIRVIKDLAGLDRVVTGTY